MASIYESPGQQVSLTGSQTGVSFQPGIAYDPSRQMLQQSERDLGAFAQFSDLLSRTLVERAKENNENRFFLRLDDRSWIGCPYLAGHDPSGAQASRGVGKPE